MLLFDAVTSVEVVLNTKTPLGSPCASSVRVPVILKVSSAESYTPGFNVVPPSSEGIRVTGVLPAASLYAVIKSSLALLAAASARWTAPLIVVLVRPSKAVPGKRPTSPPTFPSTFPPALPLITVVPVLVIVVPAKTAYVEVVPRFTVGCAAILVEGTAIVTTNIGVSINALNIPLLNAFINLFYPFFYVSSINTI